jgi:chromosome segregation protein
MHLKSLRLHGFKSFAQRVDFVFEQDVTAIVGPNGSGKSNVADAIRWVLGEQSNKLIRTRKLEDAIFSGTAKRPPAGLAEVELVFDNNDGWLPIDFSEVTLARRAYRDGESDYLLNGRKVRLKDITDLLLRASLGQNSYAIIGQGMVDAVLSMSALERRTLIDEAADVRRHRLKIEEAQQRLAATRENMARAEMLVAEIAPRVAQLERQSRRAEQHLRLAGELADALKSWYGVRWQAAHEAIAGARAALDQVSQELQLARGAQEALLAQSQALLDTTRKRRESLGRRQAERTQVDERAAALRQKLAVDAERLQSSQRRLQELDFEVRNGDEELAALRSETGEAGPEGLPDLQALQTALAGLRAEQQVLEQRAEEARAAYHVAEQEQREARHSLEQWQREERRSAEARERVETQLAQLRESLAQASTRLKDAQTARDEIDSELAQLREGVRELDLDAAAARARLDRGRREALALERRYADANREAERIQTRLELLRRMQQESQGSEAGARALLEMGGLTPADGRPDDTRIKGVLGLVSRVIKVPRGLEKAIAAALADNLNAVIVQDEREALKAIEALVRDESGQAAVFALNAVRHNYPLNLLKERGVVGVAARLVKCDERYRALVDNLLGRVIVVEDNEAALRMLNRQLGSVVTRSGILFRPHGYIRAGVAGGEANVFRMTEELERLPVELGAANRTRREVEEQLGVLRTEVDATSARLDEHTAEADGGRSLIAELDDRRIDYQHELQKSLLETETLGDRIRQLEETLAGMPAAGARPAEPEAERTEVARLAMEETLAARAEGARQVAARASELAEAEGRARALQGLAERRQQAIERLEESLAGKRAQQTALRETVEALEASRAADSQALEETERKREQLASADEPDREELARLERRERQVQEEIGAGQSRLMALERRRLEAESEVERREESLDALRREIEAEGFRLADDGQVGDRPAEVSPLAGAAPVEAAELEEQINRLRAEIRRLGPVNIDAHEDYRDARERHDFLTNQLSDLREAETGLQDAISELEEVIEERFQSAYAQVNESFQRYFEAFFGGGKAELLQLRSEGGTGIEIVAQPPGKRVQGLAVLSGGERSLTGVALLFALLAVNPAPFCVLDEVDAALDEANVGRFAAALVDRAAETQFVIITHNRRTIEAADSIYGVSMGDDGVSRVLSLRLSDVPDDLSKA